MSYRDDIQKINTLEKIRAEIRLNRALKDHKFVCDTLWVWFGVFHSIVVQYCCFSSGSVYRLLGIGMCFGFWLGICGVFVYKYSLGRLSKAQCNVALLTVPSGTVCVSVSTEEIRRDMELL